MTPARARWLSWLRVLVIAPTFGLGLLLLATSWWPGMELEHRWVALVASFAAWAWLAWLLVAVVLLTFRGRGATVLGVVALGVAVALLINGWPRQPPSRAPRSADPLTVLTLNTYYGWADGADLSGAVTRLDVDVVALQEVTTRTTVLADRAWAARFPHSAGSIGPEWSRDAGMVYSRFPLSGQRTVPEAGAMVMRVDDPAGPVTVIAVHLVNPSADFDAWKWQFGGLTRLIRSQSGPLIVLGDFNAVAAHTPLKMLLATTSLRDAASDAGPPFLATFPHQGRASLGLGPAIPLLAIDHVLSTPDRPCTEVQSIEITDTDHLGLSAAC